MDTVMTRNVDELLDKDVPIIYTITGGNTNEGLQVCVPPVPPPAPAVASLHGIAPEGGIGTVGSGQELERGSLDSTQV
eukprot:1184094-Prorocentrum_minimum.AAC.2